jgi:hypothetical protein
VLYRFILAVALVLLVSFPGLGEAADPSTPNAAASDVETLTAKVRGLLAETAASYPDPWKPGWQRPKQFFVVPGAFRAADGSEAATAVNTTDAPRAATLRWDGKSRRVERKPSEVKLLRR